jgi:uncharacterized protein (UPF0332 family)
MSFDWNEYLLLANNLAGAGNEAAYRSAVSRAYYSVFHAASVSLKSNSVATNPKYSRDRHLQVWNVYIVSADKDCKRIGNQGQRLKLDRHDADYDSEIDFTPVRVQRCIEQAQFLLTGIRAKVPEGFSLPRKKQNRLLSLIKRFLKH